MAKIVKYKTFIRLLAATGVLSLGGLGWLVFSPGEETAGQKSAVSKAAAAPTATVAEARPAPLTTEELREKLERWLEANPDRQGRMRANDILPQESFRADAIRFPEADAKKFSSLDSQWSQFRIDLNRDGRHDEKWLLKEGHTYKREVLDATGATISTSYFEPRK